MRVFVTDNTKSFFDSISLSKLNLKHSGFNKGVVGYTQQTFFILFLFICNLESVSCTTFNVPVKSSDNFLSLINGTSDQI